MVPLRLAVTFEHEQRKKDLHDTSRRLVITDPRTFSSIRLRCRRWSLCVKDDAMLPRARVQWIENTFPLGHPVLGLQHATLQKTWEPETLSRWAARLARVKWDVAQVSLASKIALSRTCSSKCPVYRHGHSMTVEVITSHDLHRYTAELRRGF